MLGLGEQSLVAIPVDKDFCMDLDSLRKTVDEIREKRMVFCIVSTAGTTSTGSIDPIEPVQEICRDIGAWHHVDGAYGLAFSLLPELEPFFKGLEKADSICWDPHKQFGVPIPNSLLFVGKAKEFQRMAVYGHYFNREGDPEPNPGLKSPPTTRPFSALPLVTTIRHQGLDKIRESLRSPVKAVRDVYEALENREDVEIFHVPQTGLLCLRIAPQGISEDRLDQLQAHLYENIKKEGKRSISMTRLRNKAVLRLVAISPSVTAQSMLATIDVARDLAEEY